MSQKVERDRGKRSKVSQVVSDEKVLDPEDELAVQIPEEADGRLEAGLDVHAEPTAEEVFAQASAEAEDSEDEDSKADDKAE